MDSGAGGTKHKAHYPPQAIEPGHVATPDIAPIVELSSPSGA